MAVEIGTLVLKGRFGAARREEPDRSAEIEARLDALRDELLRDIDDRLDAAERRARER